MIFSTTSIMESWEILFEAFIYLKLIVIIINSHPAFVSHSYTFQILSFWKLKTIFLIF